MKITKTASGTNKIKISRKEWEAIGKKAGWNDFEREKYDFAAGKEKAKKMSSAELHYAIKDLKEVIEVQEKSSKEGASTPKLGYYHDELHTYLAELKERQGAR